MTRIASKAIFLDLDGTLVDPKPGITGSVIHALTSLGMDAPHPDDLEWVIGPPLLQSFANLGAPDPAAALAYYRAEYTSGQMYDVAVYDGVFDTLTALRDHRLFLATAKPHAYARKITARLGLAEYFEREYGPELDGTRDDKGALLLYALEELGLDPKDCVMIGDRANDLAAARKSGMAFVGALWGYGGVEELDGADALATTPGDIAVALAKLR